LGFSDKGLKDRQGKIDFQFFLDVFPKMINIHKVRGKLIC
jgi:hypothetical protein